MKKKVLLGEELTREEERSLRQAMTGILLFLPRLVLLMVRLLRDRRVASTDKAILAGAIIYVISPIDFIPDFIPFIGEVDDIFLVGLALLRIINRSGPEVVREHWGGEIDIKHLVEIIVKVAVIFLPKKAGDALVNKVEPHPGRPRLVKSVKKESAKK